ncbi:686_t:CDS:2, partial [Gigaspora margarita]
MPQGRLENSKRRNHKSRPEVSSKPKEKRPTIPEVLELCYTLESSEENNTANQELEEKKTKCVNKANKPRIRKAKTKTYEPYQESNTIKTSTLKENLLGSKKEINLKLFLLKITDKIDNEKNISEEYLIDSKKSLITKLNRASIIELNLQSTKVNNIGNYKLQNRNANSNKKNLKSIKDNRINVQYDPEISCQDELDLVKNTKLTKDIEDNMPIKE